MGGAFLALILIIVMICALGSIAGQVGMTVSTNGTGVVVGNANKLAEATAVVNRSIADADAVRREAESKAQVAAQDAMVRATATGAYVKSEVMATATGVSLKAQATSTMLPIMVTREILENKRIENNIHVTATVAFAQADSQRKYILTGNRVVDFLVFTVGVVYVFCGILVLRAISGKANKKYAGRYW